MSKANRTDATGSIASSSDERPWTVQQAAQFLGVSPQTVYLWVERKRIPHLRVMGRNIRFLRSDLETFRASFKQDIEKVSLVAVPIIEAGLLCHYRFPFYRIKRTPDLRSLEAHEFRSVKHADPHPRAQMWQRENRPLDAGGTPFGSAPLFFRPAQGNHRSL